MSVPTSQEVKSSSSGSSQLCRQFTFSEIQRATQNLDESLVKGRGGFGKVYKGTITNGSNLLTVAIKRLDSTSNQGAAEFWAEVNMLSNLRHCHLVSLIGYCNDGEEMILVYEYMSHGTLADHLHGCQTPLSWVQRLAICIGAARGLDYLHTGTGIKDGVVHRDVKSSNILLHNSWEAKISDFGLSKICPKNQQSTYVNTGVKGTFGYIDPDYFYTGKLTRKSDVYAFGVVLFEVLCGKRAVGRGIDAEQWGLAAWAQNSIKEGRLKQIVDINIRGSMSPKCLKEFAQLAKRCLHKQPKQRPTMAEVVVALELQKKANSTSQPTGMLNFAKEALMVISGGINQTLYRFDFDIINAATENFSEANRIPQQKTHDSVYKGKLQNGQSIAVSRIYQISKSEYKRFMNEASKLVSLEHENLAKLLGYCVKGTTLYLVYDFALHASLDRLMSDPERTVNWDKLYKIILGVARALLYLHRDAPIPIIHGDVNPRNIFLSEDFNPVLSGFLNTRYIDNSQNEMRMFSDTRYYAAPKYSYYSNRSTKADIYSFGVLVTEIIAWYRKPNIGSSPENIERITMDSSSIKRSMKIGWLCAVIFDRPKMEEVVSMLLDPSVEIDDRSVHLNHSHRLIDRLLVNYNLS